jgi:hypothetical protein
MQGDHLRPLFFESAPRDSLRREMALFTERLARHLIQPALGLDFGASRPFCFENGSFLPRRVSLGTDSLAAHPRD